MSTSSVRDRAPAPSRTSVRPPSQRPVADLTIIVPAYDEAESIADTVRSLQAQTLVPAEIIVVDDGSSDGTGDIARALGVTVLRPPVGTGSKAGAQNFALPCVRTSLTMAVDADTTLAPDALELLLPALEEDGVAAVCGFVIPRHVRTLFERGRYVEYLYAFGFAKQVQDFYGKPLISSGCFSAYRTDVLRAMGGWGTRTMAEDMDLTWSLYQAGYGVRFVPEAVSYPIEPHNLRFMNAQLKRWSHGFVQNVRLHARGLLGLGYLRMMVTVALWDAVFASVGYLLVVPLLALLVSPWFLLVYVIDTPAVLVPVVAEGLRRGELGRALASVPAFLALRFLNSVHMLRALVVELVLRRPLLHYEKGH